MSPDRFWLQIRVNEENSVKLLWIFINSDVLFHGHVKIICKKASQKISAIGKLANVIFYQKREVLTKTIFESQLSYFLLMYMFCGWRLDRRINRFHERTLPIAYEGPVLKNFHHKIVLLGFSTETCKCWLLKCMK